MSLDIDLSPLWEQINLHLPNFLLVFGIFGGIAIAMAVAKLLIREIRKAFMA